MNSPLEQFENHFLLSLGVAGDSSGSMAITTITATAVVLGLGVWVFFNQDVTPGPGRGGAGGDNPGDDDEERRRRYRNKVLRYAAVGLVVGVTLGVATFLGFTYLGAQSAGVDWQLDQFKLDLSELSTRVVRPEVTVRPRPFPPEVVKDVVKPAANSVSKFLSRK